MDMDMHYGHGHAAWAWTHSTALIMQHVSGQWTCMDAGMPECRNADKKFSPALLVFRQFMMLFRHRHSGIMVSPVPLVTDQSVSAQLCPPPSHKLSPRLMPCFLGSRHFTDLRSGTLALPENMNTVTRASPTAHTYSCFDHANLCDSLYNYKHQNSNQPKVVYTLLEKASWNYSSLSTTDFF